MGKGWARITHVGTIS